MRRATDRLVTLKLYRQRLIEDRLCLQREFLIPICTRFGNSVLDQCVNINKWSNTSAYQSVYDAIKHIEQGIYRPQTQISDNDLLSRAIEMETAHH